MGAPEHPLLSLVGPARYASAREYANLDRVRGLKALVEACVGAAARAGLSPETLSELRRVASAIEAPQRRAREHAVASLMSILTGAGVLERSGSGAEKTSKTKTKPETRTKSKSTSTSSEKTSEHLSIAPRSGPVGAPLRGAGRRLSPRLLSALNRRGLTRVGDLLFLLPRAYEDRRRIQSVASLEPGQPGVAVVTVKEAGEIYLRGRRRSFRAVLGDATGTLCVTYFQSGPWLKGRFPVGARMLVSGQVRLTPNGVREMAHPEVEPAEELDANAAPSVGSGSAHFGRIVPIYPGFERHEQRMVRALAADLAREHAGAVEDPLPVPIRAALGLLPLNDALHALHWPSSHEDLEALGARRTPAFRRLAFDELFFMQLGLCLRRRTARTAAGISFDASPGRCAQARQLLPFELTRAQARVLDEIAKDMQRPEPMNRLLQGDVGSGKTAVAAVSAALALLDGYQVALMAPTELLADQHARTLTRYLAPRGFEVALITGAGTASARAARRAGLSVGRVHVAVGTHALLSDPIEFAGLGLVIIDEQHRFGVMQRHALMSKGRTPDVLVMSATPIPRTLAMTLYGDLDVSVIDELPPGRSPVTTKVFPERARDRVFERVRAALDRGEQVYVVYPLVEESETLDLADATRGVVALRARFPDLDVGLLHGRLAPVEKEAVMERFRSGETRVLVCTTVVEVGVDVPNASMMVIESAERFGLSQLHQLRGRVGRGAAKSECLLLRGAGRSPGALARLSVLEETTDGFVVAEKDLELRGPGELLGTRQSGLPELAVANLVRDTDLLSQARALARRLLEEDPALTRPEHAPLVRALEERWEGRLALGRVG